MNKRFDNLDLQSLYDLLAVQTKRYTSALANGRREKLVLYRQTIDSLVGEIRRRKNGVSSTNQFVEFLPR